MPHSRGHTALSDRNSGAQAEKPEDIEVDSRTLVSPKQPSFLQRLQGSFAETLQEAHHISAITR